MKYYPLEHEVTQEDIKKFNFPNQKIGVIAYIENQNGEILLQQRGTKSYDENGLFEDIGGKVEDTDTSYKNAIMREIKEEAGNELELIIGNAKGIVHCPKNNVNWIFIVYAVKYISGKFKIMEHDKCLKYCFFKRDDALSSNLVTESCKFIIQNIDGSIS